MASGSRTTSACSATGITWGRTGRTRVFKWKIETRDHDTDRLLNTVWTRRWTYAGAQEVSSYQDHGGYNILYRFTLLRWCWIRADRHEWHYWFAWYPVVTVEYGLVWLRWLNRKTIPADFVETWIFHKPLSLRIGEFLTGYWHRI